MNSFDIKQSYTGLIDKTAVFLINNQLSNKALWHKFADQFRHPIDGANGGWRGEYWGKMMRGASLVYEYSHNEELYSSLTETVKEMISLIGADGRISSYTQDKEFTSWDIWCRKYVILGMEYYLDICRDEELKSQIIGAISRAADYIIDRIGNENGKLPITSTGRWLGLNSSSILEPMVRLYKLTKEKKYFDFCEYIVETGGSEINVFKLAYEDSLKPYQYGVSKAYEMMSCFEGLLEFYLVTGIEKYKTAVINFANAIIETEVSVIGSSGCTHELFDHTKTRQTQYYEGIMQETCVTVTWMKLCSKVLMLTGNSIYADEMERSFYNAYLGAVNTSLNVSTDPYVKERYVKLGIEDKMIATPLPFDSYSPLTPGRRGRRLGGFQILEDGSYYGCCVCIGSAGVGIFAKHAVVEADGYVTVNFYENGNNEISTDKGKIIINTETKYPADGKITLKIDTECDFILKLRIPSWSKVLYEASQNGYAIYNIKKGKSDIGLCFDMSLRTTLPEKWDLDVLYISTSTTRNPPIAVRHYDRDDNYISISRGPITLAADSSLGKDANSVFSFKKLDDKIVCSVCDNDGKHTLKCKFIDKNGEEFCLVDYASAGKDWASDIAAWLPTK